MADIKLFDSHEPALKAGTYSIEISQTLSVGEGQTLEASAQELVFKVEAEKYAIDQQQIDSVFPPAGSMGDFSLVLPHIILNRSTLPWEREAVDGDVHTPWLGLLLFTEEEIGEVAKPGLDPQPEYEPEKCYSFHLKKSDFEANSLPSNPVEPDHSESAGELISVIVATKSFLKENILPGYGELPYLCHVRSRSSGADTDEKDEKAVVVCNRLPQIDRKHIVHLVSLEDCFSSNDENEVSFKKDKGDTDNIALVSLKSWEFFCNDHFILTEEVIESLSIFPDDPSKNESLVEALRAIEGNEYYKDEDLIAAIKDAVKNGSEIEAKKEELYATFRIGHLPDILKHLNRKPASLRGPDFYISAEVLDTYKEDKTKIPDTRYQYSTNDLSDALSLVVGIEYFDEGELVNDLVEPYITSYQKRKDEDTLNEEDNKNLAKVDYLLDTFRIPMSNLGFVNLPYILKSGKAMEAIYRGPLGPVSSGNGDDTLINLRHADQALRFFSEAGKLDVSYAAAWEIGKLLAIQNKNFSVALYKWKRECYQALKRSTPANGTNFPVVPPLVGDWFSKLKDLKNIPFNYLLPDPAFIPFESIRFFSVDETWIRHLIDGAFSIGRISEIEVGFDKSLYESPDLEFLKVPAGGRSGFLLHSVAVAGWPDLVIHKGEKPVNSPDDPRPDEASENEPVVKTTLSQNLLLCLFHDELGSVSIHQKPGSVHFGFEERDGKIYAGDNEVMESFFPNKRVNVNDLVSKLIPTLNQNGGKVATFTNKLVQKIEVITFNAKP